MAQLERTWPVDAFDAINIVATDGQFEIAASDGDQVELEVEFEKLAGGQPTLETTGRWLQVHLWERRGEAQLTMRLPRSRAWVVDLSAARGQVEVNGIRGRLRIMLARGNIHASNCEGSLNFASGKGEVQLEDCVEAPAPERPPMPEAEVKFEVPPIPKGPFAHGTFGFEIGKGPRARFRMGGPQEWMEIPSEEWAEWGAQVGEHARVWAEQFVGHMVGHFGWVVDKQGLSVYLGKGDANLERVEAQTCAVRVGNGNVELQRGRIQDLSVGAGSGEIECSGVLPTGEWSLQTRRGDISLELPADSQARLDAATRHGDIDSQAPLVRVPRPGPESRHGGRMVGTVGPTEGKGAEINLTALHGDIKIELSATPSGYAAATAKAAAAPEPAASAAPQQAGGEAPPAPTAESAPPAAEQAAAPEQAQDAPAAAVAEGRFGLRWWKKMERTKESGEAKPPVYDSQLAVLEALSRGEISVDEAEKLLSAK